ncbi:hypothetical protein N657DRAFT_247734 [Parathielavia appendiculata]|uniref:Uncharacterized protein n=1 Tax=Parathielavia appendiculata TaxID=2587402 RepID=A0AAN6TS77_9PEZI|nr:hypothetical protein N657DRAFT_247734 [Parathielavia appendiculata]
MTLLEAEEKASSWLPVEESMCGSPRGRMGHFVGSTARRCLVRQTVTAPTPASPAAFMASIRGACLYVATSTPTIIFGQCRYDLREQPGTIFDMTGVPGANRVQVLFLTPTEILKMQSGMIRSLLGEYATLPAIQRTLRRSLARHWVYIYCHIPLPCFGLVLELTAE